MKRVAFAAGMLAALALSTAPAAAVPRPGDAAPAFALTALNGKSISPASFAGHALYLNFFATWCGPCRVETPSIVLLSRKYAPQGLVVLGIDVGEDAPKAQSYVGDFHIPYPLAPDPNSTTRASYGGGLYFPLHVFIDRRGVVRIYHPGEMSAGEIEAAIRSVLAR